jgi:YqjK-like protein
MKPKESAHAHRTQLIERAASERDELARQLGEWRRPLRNVDRGLAVYQGFKRSLPVIGFGAGVAMAALAFVRPDSVGGWIEAGRNLWQLLAKKKPAAAPGADVGAAARLEPAPGHAVAE